MKTVSRLRKQLLIFATITFLGIPKPAKADIWGGDVAVLVQILANALQQLIRLKEIVGTHPQNLILPLIHNFWPIMTALALNHKFWPIVTILALIHKFTVNHIFQII